MQIGSSVPLQCKYCVKLRHMHLALYSLSFLLMQFEKPSSFGQVRLQPANSRKHREGNTWVRHGPCPKLRLDLPFTLTLKECRIQKSHPNTMSEGIKVTKICTSLPSPLNILSLTSHLQFDSMQPKGYENNKTPNQILYSIFHPECIRS